MIKLHYSKDWKFRIPTIFFGGWWMDMLEDNNLASTPFHRLNVKHPRVVLPEIWEQRRLKTPRKILHSRKDCRWNKDEERLFLVFSPPLIPFLFPSLPYSPPSVLHSPFTFSYQGCCWPLLVYCRLLCCPTYMVTILLCLLPSWTAWGRYGTNTGLLTAAFCPACKT